jgi:signal transduction histidine kinase
VPPGIRQSISPQTPSPPVDDAWRGPAATTAFDAVRDADAPAPARAVSIVRRLLAGWNRQSLARQFLLLGGLVSVLAMLAVGTVVTRLIEKSVIRNSAATTALFVDSIIAPLLPDMQRTEVLDVPASRALDETLGHGALGTRLVSFRLWRRDGTILYADEDALVGRRLEPPPELEAAFEGHVAAEFGRFSGRDGEEGPPLLRIYNPVLQPWSGEVVAVSQFDELAAEFERDLARARRTSWLSVAAVTLGLFLALSLVVLRGSRIIDRQRLDLRRRVTDLSRLLRRNEELHARVQGASRRGAALNESYLRRIGADLHDGPAQLVALAALRLDSLTLADGDRTERVVETAAVKAYLDDAMEEIRSICSGLVLPQIETAQPGTILRRAADAHERRTGTQVALSVEAVPDILTPAEKICVYRFVQEALSNSYRHAGGKGQAIAQRLRAGELTIAVADRGPGFDPEAIGPESLGLAGLRDRVESLGGVFAIDTSPAGTTIRMALPIQEKDVP